MSEELKNIKALKKRATEMLKGNYTRKIGDEEIYTIICEWEKATKEIEEKEQTIKILRKTKPIEEVFHDLIKEKDYISKDKIREKIKELEERTKQEKTITFYCNSNDIARTVISNFNELLEEN